MLSPSKYAECTKINSLSKKQKMVANRALNMLGFFADIVSYWIISEVWETKICNLNWEQHNINPVIMKEFKLN